MWRPYSHEDLTQRWPEWIQIVLWKVEGPLDQIQQDTHVHQLGDWTLVLVIHGGGGGGTQLVCQLLSGDASRSTQVTQVMSDTDATHPFFDCRLQESAKGLEDCTWYWAADWHGFVYLPSPLKLKVQQAKLPENDC